MLLVVETGCSRVHLSCVVVLNCLSHVAVSSISMVVRVECMLVLSGIRSRDVVSSGVVVLSSRCMRIGVCTEFSSLSSMVSTESRVTVREVVGRGMVVLVLHVTISTRGLIVGISSKTMHVDKAFGVLNLLGTFMADIGILVNTMGFANGT